MDGPLAGLMGLCLLAGVLATGAGSYDCIRAHTYSVAAQHQATTVGHVVGMIYGKGSHAYKYVFSINGVALDDYSDVCSTPLVADACWNRGPVLVYYAYEPYTNSRLEDFAISSARAYRAGKPELAGGLLLLLIAGGGIYFLTRREQRDGPSSPEDRRGRSGTDDVPDAIHVVPGE